LKLSAMAVMGQSCGGLQALEAAGDPRVKTAVILNSGIVRPGGGAAPRLSLPGTPETLKTLHTPVIYLIGGPSDIAHKNAETDFREIEGVPLLPSQSRRRAQRYALAAARREVRRGRAGLAVVAVEGRPAGRPGLRRAFLWLVPDARVDRPAQGVALSHRSIGREPPESLHPRHVQFEAFIPTRASLPLRFPVFGVRAPMRDRRLVLPVRNGNA